jgi:hypothetical protein
MNIVPFITFALYKDIFEFRGFHSKKDHFMEEFRIFRTRYPFGGCKCCPGAFGYDCCHCYSYRLSAGGEG